MRRCTLKGGSEERHVFTWEDIERRFDACRGKTLGEIDDTGVFAGKPKNKGVAGMVVEQSILGYPPDSRQEPDIEVDGVPYEVKTTGLVYDGDTRKKTRAADGKGDAVSVGGIDVRKLEAKEPMSVTAVSVNTIWRETFDDSHFWHKLEHLLIAYYFYNDGNPAKVDSQEYARFPFIDYELHVWDDDDRAVLASDWQIVRDFVARVHEEGLDPDEEYPKISHELNRALLYTDTSPKWPNPPRWRLKRSTVTALVREHFSGELEHLPVQVRSFADIEHLCADVTDDYAGTTVAEIARELGYTGSLMAKSVNEALIVRMLGGHATKMSRVDAFLKADIQCKTVTFSHGEARMTEDTKFVRIDFDEVMDATISWEESVAREAFTRRILCPVFREPSKEAPLADNVFLGFKWIDLDDHALEEAHRVWEEVRRLVLTGDLRDVPQLTKSGVQRVNRKTGLASSAPNFPKARDAYAVFVRGDSTDSSDKPLVINGIPMYRQYFWLKRQWVIRHLAEEPFIGSES